MKISGSRRKIIAKLFVNFSGIIFGLLVIGPFVSGKDLNFQVFLIGTMLLVASSMLSVISEPIKLEEENESEL